MGEIFGIAAEDKMLMDKHEIKTIIDFLNDFNIINSPSFLDIIFIISIIHYISLRIVNYICLKYFSALFHKKVFKNK
ncbi:hypothetical protein JCM16775_1274 [Leptotrichia hofstadii]|uniref:Uncharacterized protein n=1 Tax=Leptotrichia hofstadii TaxID=157688 RepID=A0A510JJW8_9FUSO|nr:hypothetical protein JCM16775_1274 [Leptotrichia hofstadii]